MQTHGSAYSLFVYKRNVSAKKLYENIGFKIYDYPDEEEYIDGCLFMVKKT